jgi:hypothetical protein
MAIEEGFQANSMSMSAIAADGHSIAMYGKHIIKMEITDSLRECRVSEIKFIAIDIKRYDTILG